MHKQNEQGKGTRVSDAQSKFKELSMFEEGETELIDSPFMVWTQAFWLKEADYLIKKLSLKSESAVREEICEKISQLENPYPEDVFVSIEGKAANNAYECAKQDAIKAIKEARDGK